MKSTANASVQNQMNVSIVFNYLRETGPAYRAQIARHLGLSLPAVSRAVENLMLEGYVVQGPAIDGGTGRGAPSVRVNVEKATVLGVDLLSEKLRMAAFDLGGAKRRDYIGRGLSDSEDIVRDLLEEIRIFLAKLGQSKEGSRLPSVKALTIGIPAIVDVESQKLLNAYLNDNLEGVDLSTALSEELRIPVYVENIVKLAALGEYHYGRGKRYQNLLFIEIGKGVGAGAIVDGELLRGEIGAAGEIGFMIVDEGHLDSAAGQKGYLENQISTSALRDAARDAIASGRSPAMERLVGGDTEQPSVDTLFEAAMQGDVVAQSILEGAVAKLSIAVLNSCLVLNPQIVVFGGDITACSGAEELVARPVLERLERLLPFQPPEVALSSLHQDSSLYGASLMGAEALLTGIYPYALPVWGVDSKVRVHTTAPTSSAP